MPYDPRRRASTAVEGGVVPPLPPPPPPVPVPPVAKPILLREDDAMDEDEDIDMAVPGLLPVVASAAVDAAVASAAAPTFGAASASTAISSTGIESEDKNLISRIITPSPFPQHHAATSGSAGVGAASRFRNALTRVTQNPTRDAEAWQAILAEANACYKTIENIHAVDAETHLKLDWVESCYGALLAHYPYATDYYTGIAELLYAQSARMGEEHGPLVAYGYSSVSQRALKCEAKLQHLFQITLGVGGEGGTSTGTVASDSNAMCSWCVELWLLYIQKATRDAHRSVVDEEQRALQVREATLKAFEMAVSQAGFGHNNHLLWKQYLAFVKSWIYTTTPGSVVDHALAQQQMLQLRSVYQRLVTFPMTGLDQLWQEYESFEKSHSEALAAALLSEFSPKYQHARTIYLERNRVYGSELTELLNTRSRLATEPVHHSSNQQLLHHHPDDKKNDDEEDYIAAKMEEEYKLLKLWKVRCAYERSNPERLPLPRDLQHRIRSAYKEMVCVLTRHPECWHMWSMWELSLHTGTITSDQDTATTSTTSSGSSATSATFKTSNSRAIDVLQLGQSHIPDCTLLCLAEAQIVELYTPKPIDCVAVMENFLQRCPNTLAFVLTQRMVRRYHGAEAARAVFSRARRTLADNTGDVVPTGSSQKKVVVDSSAADVDEEEAQDQAATAGNQVQRQDDENGNHKKRWMVTNRLDETVKPYPTTTSLKPEIPGSSSAAAAATTPSDSSPKAPVTWHLYASHAMMEHRLNHAPEIAARVYELGLRKHSSFLTKPPYVMRYAQLLMELGDSVNLRALLTRAISACEDSSSTESSSNHQGGGSASLAILWDLYLRFESVLSGADPSGAARLREIEKKRRQAVMGADAEDVATGGPLSSSDVALIGAQKATISEQLIRAEGYDVSSNIVSGMSRSVDLLETMGLWGNDASSLSAPHQRARQDKDLEISGGSSDTSYYKRLQFQALASAGFSAESAGAEGVVVGGTKILSARERLQQGAAGAIAGAGQPSAMMLAIQQSPEWLRPLLLLLPASRLRLPIVAKPPPHMTEMALNSLRQNQLPVERPMDTTNGSNKRKSAGGGGDSSDEENDIRTGQGYGNFFRSRQRARMTSQPGTTD